MKIVLHDCRQRSCYHIQRSRLAAFVPRTRQLLPPPTDVELRICCHAGRDRTLNPGKQWHHAKILWGTSKASSALLWIPLRESRCAHFSSGALPSSQHHVFQRQGSGKDLPSKLQGKLTEQISFLGELDVALQVRHTSRSNPSWHEMSWRRRERGQA